MHFSRFLKMALILGLLSAIGPFAIDMYLPALPDIGASLGASVGAVQWSLTAFFLALGAVAFVFDTVGGVLFAKLANLFLKKKINPMIGACGISAFPMSGRVIAKMALKEDPSNYIIQHAMGVNVAGQVASVVAGGLVLALIPVLG